MPTDNCEEKDMIIDTYIRTNVRGFGTSNNLEVSREFGNKVMSAVLKCEKRRSMRKVSLLALIGLSPFLLRLTWLWARNDYFSISEMPMGEYIVKAYSVFLSPFTAYALLAIGVGFALYTFKTKYINAVLTKKTQLA
jgi:hypothetical protein